MSGAAAMAVTARAARRRRSRHSLGRLCARLDTREAAGGSPPPCGGRRQAAAARVHVDTRHAAAARPKLRIDSRTRPAIEAGPACRSTNPRLKAAQDSAAQVEPRCRTRQALKAAPRGCAALAMLQAVPDAQYPFPWHPSPRRRLQRMKRTPAILTSVGAPPQIAVHTHPPPTRVCGCLSSPPSYRAAAAAARRCVRGGAGRGTGLADWGTWVQGPRGCGTSGARQACATSSPRRQAPPSSPDSRACATSSPRPARRAAGKGAGADVACWSNSLASSVSFITHGGEGCRCGCAAGAADGGG